VADRQCKDLVLKIGSDDQVAACLNGLEILHVSRPRALTVDEDVIANVSSKREAMCWSSRSSTRRAIGLRVSA
jgi:hypothetical protein